MRTIAVGQVVEAAVGRRQRLREPLRLVVDRARRVRVDVAVVRLGLRVHVGIAVDLARRREQEAGVVREREVERAARAERADVDRLERDREVLGRARRAREVQHAVDVAVDRDLVAHVGADEREARVLGEVRDVLEPARRQVVDRDDLVAAREERVAEVRADEAGSARDDDARHLPPPDALVREAPAAHRGRIEQVAGVDDRGAAHRVAHPVEVEPAELVPLGEQHDRVGARRRVVGVGAQLDARERARAAGRPRRGRRRARSRPPRGGAGRRRSRANRAGRRCRP